MAYFLKKLTTKKELIFKYIQVFMILNVHMHTTNMHKTDAKMHNNPSFRQ